MWTPLGFTAFLDHGNLHRLIRRKLTNTGCWLVGWLVGWWVVVLLSNGCPKHDMSSLTSALFIVNSVLLLLGGPSGPGEPGGFYTPTKELHVAQALVPSDHLATHALMRQHVLHVKETEAVASACENSQEAQALHTAAGSPGNSPPLFDGGGGGGYGWLDDSDASQTLALLNHAGPQMTLADVCALVRYGTVRNPVLTVAVLQHAATNPHQALQWLYLGVVQHARFTDDACDAKHQQHRFCITLRAEAGGLPVQLVPRSP
jgi:hypothetical protein